MRGSLCLRALHSGTEQIFSLLWDCTGCRWAKGRGRANPLGEGRCDFGRVAEQGMRGQGACPAPAASVGFCASCGKGTFHLSLAMPSVAWQSRAEVMLHMAHSLLSAGNASFEILERGKVTLRKPRSGGPPLCLRPGWVSICLRRRQPCSVWP